LSRSLLPLLLVAMAGALMVVALRAGTPAMPLRYDPDSAAGDGHKGLRLWLQEQGYAVETTTGERFVVDESAHLLIVAPGDHAWTDAEARRVARWVEGGGSVAILDPPDAALVEAFGLAGSVSTAVAEVVQAQPLLPAAPAAWPLAAERPLAPARTSGSVPVLATAAGEPTLLVQQLGQGWVWQLSGEHPLTNDTLRTPEQAAVPTALLRGVPNGGRVLFDTFHLFGPDQEQPIDSLQAWLYRTAPGRALLFAFCVTGLYLLLAGRRLGPPLESPSDGRRREAAEYVRALAGLKRRAGALEAVAAHQRRRLKAGLAHSRGVAAVTDDAEFVRLLAHSDALPAAAVAQVEQLLATLERAANETAVIQAAAEIDRLLGLRAAAIHPSPSAPATTGVPPLQPPHSSPPITHAPEKAPHGSV
jgi:hypothetical protein